MNVWTFDDGGRGTAGFKGKANDCFVRAVAIATGLRYAYVYEMVNYIASKPAARNGVSMRIARLVMKSLGWEWVSCMKIGQGCRVHLTRTELPTFPVVARLSRHFCAVVDGTIHDNHDCTRDGTRCVYGYWISKDNLLKALTQSGPQPKSEGGVA